MDNNVADILVRLSTVEDNDYTSFLKTLSDDEVSKTRDFFVSSHSLTMAYMGSWVNLFVDEHSRRIQGKRNVKLNKLGI